MLYYLILTVSVVLFGVQFGFNQIYEKESDGSVRSSFLFVFGTAAVGIPILWVINGVRLSCTVFSLIMAVVSSVNMILCNYCSLKALGRVNLSLFSIFSMLGGMILPFVTGILFFDEALTVGKLICLVILSVAVLITVDLKEKKSGMLYCFAVFVFNGLSGVISKLYTSLPFEKVSQAMFSLLCAAVCTAIAAVPLIILRKPPLRPTKKGLLATAGAGAFNRTANYLLLLSLAQLPASVQYPFVTGGVIIVSTVISCLTGQKPSKKEIVSMMLSFVGIALLLIIP
ncbi:MAG: EamA family transporter [Clostridia bacterium]|nr:EamA family transporter [Clostridia bacterium]